jgi:hypothetical protein
MHHSQSAQNVVNSAPFAVRKAGHVNNIINKDGDAEATDTVSIKRTTINKPSQPRQSRSKTQSTDDSHIHTTINTIDGDISSGDIYLDQHLRAPALPSSAPHAAASSLTNNNNNTQSASTNGASTRRTTSSSKVVSKIMNAMASAASTADRDRLVRDNNHMQSAGETSDGNSSSKRLGAVTEGAAVTRQTVYHMYRYFISVL